MQLIKSNSEYLKTHGKNLSIEFGIANSRFGECAIAWCDMGIMHIDFLDDEKNDTAIERIKNDWPLAKFNKNNTKAQTIMNDLIEDKTDSFTAFLTGTPFQVKVWNALLTIPFGQQRTYSDIAKSINNKNAVRAVGTAIGKNPLAFLIPCHRVIRNDGTAGGYRWGLERKRAMLNFEKNTVSVN